MDIETVARWLSAVAFAISIISAIIVYLNSPGRKIEASLKQVSTSLDEHKTGVSDALKTHDRRIQAVESEMKHLPTSDEFAELQVSVKSVEGDVKLFGELLARVSRTTDRIDDFLRASK